MSAGQNSFQNGDSGYKNNSVELCFDIETTGLDPLNDRITAIGISNGSVVSAIVDKDEKRMLEEFWMSVGRGQYVRLIGFNCWSFDIPFIVIRSLKHGVKVIDINGKVIDLRYLLSNGNKFQQAKLDQYAKLIGIEPKYHGYNGLDAIRLWNENKLDELKEYVSADAKMTYLLYKRVKEINLVK